MFSGLGGDTIVDIDYFPQDGLLYGTASNGRLYSLNPLTGSATVNTSGGVGNVGTVMDADFNPVANRVRIYSTGDANFRLTPGTGVVTNDGTLTYQPGDANFGANPNLRGSAYTNSFGGALTTSLYSIDSDLDTLVLHPAPGPAFSNLSTVGELTINGLAINFGNDVGFDIFSFAGNLGYVTNGGTLYDLDLATGDLVPLGTIGGPGGPAVLSLAVVPEPGVVLLSTAALGLLALRRRRC